MKKSIAFLLAVFVAALCSCSADTAVSTPDNVVSTPENAVSTPQDAEESTVLSGDEHTHSFSDATCTVPAKCACGATKGKALGHNWKEATCKSPKTCARCGATEGKALGHNWKEATCQEPKTCTRCGETSGDKAKHSPDPSTGKCTLCGKLVYSANDAMRVCMKKANWINADYFDDYRILNVYYVENKPCLCDKPIDNNLISVFIYFSYGLDGESGYDLDVYDVHGNDSTGYEVIRSNIDVYYTYNDNDEITRIRTKDYSVHYDSSVLKKADLGKIL